MAGTTTVQVPVLLKRRLDALKETPRQTYGETIEKLVDLAVEDRAELAPETKRALAKAREDVRRGRVYTTRELIRELSI